MNLEPELRALDVEWPATPELRLVLGRRRRRWPVLVLALVIALAAAFAVPQSRGAILRFFHIGSETIKVVDTLPPAEERPLDANLGIPVTLADAQSRIDGLKVPAVVPPLHATGEAVSMVFTYHDKPVLLTEVPGDGVAALKKLASGQTKIQWIELRKNVWAVWLSGAPHVYLFPREPARFAGNTLVWVEGRTTYRLEGPTLSREEAVDLARSLRYPGGG